LVDSESHVLHCHRYIDLNPVRARRCDDPAQFPWSSAAAHCGFRSDPLLIAHPAYTALGATEVERSTAYQALLRETLSDDELQAIRTYLQQQRALGHDASKVMVEAKIQRFAGTRPAHRPPRK
jgi:putative transposase